MNRFSIGDLENLTGIKAHTIRIWEKRYNILQPKRTAGNVRYYDAADLKNVLRVALLNNYGVKISAIHKMSEAEINKTIGSITDGTFRLQALLNDLMEATVSMDLVAFEQALDDYSRLHGIESMVEELLMRYLEKVGLMWLSDQLFPAQEHLVSNILMRKLAFAIEGLPRPSADARGVLLFLPEGEIHEIGLLYMHFLFRKYGKSPIYLGPNTPLEEAAFVFKEKRPAYIYIHLTAVGEDFNVSEYISELNVKFGDTPVFVSGSILNVQPVVPPAHIHLVRSLSDARRIAKTLNQSV